MAAQTKTIKTHLRLTEDDMRSIQAFAEVDSRTLQDEMRFLMVTLGLHFRRSGITGIEAERRRTESPNVAEEIFQRNLPLEPMTPIAAKRRQLSQRRTG